MDGKFRKFNFTHAMSKVQQIKEKSGNEIGLMEKYFYRKFSYLFFYIKVLFT